MGLDLVTCMAALVIAVVVDTAWVALFRSRPVGVFVVEREGSAIFRFKSSTGSFTILPKDRLLDYSTRSLQNRVAFDDIRGLRYCVNEEHAILQELWMGLDLTDLLPQYQDVVEWFAISVVTRHGEEIPLYLSGQYRRREFLLGWYIDWQYRLLERWGLSADVEARSQAAMEKIRTRLGSPPLL